MASHLANLLFSAVGGAKPVQPAPAKPATEDKDRFAQLLDSQTSAPKPAENTANATSPAPANDQQPAVDANAAPQPNDEGAVATEAKAPDAADVEIVVEETDTPSLADALLAALAALGLQPETVTAGGEAEAVVIDPAALEDIKSALEDLSQVLGLDMSALVQQLTDLAKGVAADASTGAAPDLMSKLTALIGDKLGALNGKLGPDAETALTKLMDGIGKLAEALPTEPELATPQLKLTEPVLAGKTSAAAEPATTVASVPVETEDSDSLAEIKLDDGGEDRQPSVSGAKGSEAVAEGTKPAANQSQAARPAGAQDNSLNLTASAPSQADAATPKVDASAAQRVVQAGYQTSQQQLNLPQIAFELSRQVQDGNSRFQIRLDPPELGRIDVKLDIDSNGQVHAKLTVEKAETLDLMQRDQRALERALQQAGLDQNKTNLEFSLKQNPFAGDRNQGSGGDQQAGSSGQDGGEDADTPVPAVTLYRGNLSASGLNIIA